MKQQEVIRFFNGCASDWDAQMVRNEAVIAQILDNTPIRPGDRVLDVACGTGVLFPDYLSRGVGSLTAIDISPQMVKIAREKFPQVEVLCGDVETEPFSQKFDAIVVYNAFPHFPDPRGLIESLASHLVPGGRLTVAHGGSRETINAHHAASARPVSLSLPEAPALAELFAPWFHVDVVISDNTMYQVAGSKR